MKFYEDCIEDNLEISYVIIKHPVDTVGFG